jgi:hypothetical protein
MKTQVNHVTPLFLTTKQMQFMYTVTTQTRAGKEMVGREFFNATRRAGRARGIRTAEGTTKNKQKQTNSKGRARGNHLEKSNIGTMGFKNRSCELSGRLVAKSVPGKF